VSSSCSASSALVSGACKPPLRHRGTLTTSVTLAGERGEDSAGLAGPGSWSSWPKENQRTQVLPFGMGPPPGPAKRSSMKAGHEGDDRHRGARRATCGRVGFLMLVHFGNSSNLDKPTRPAITSRPVSFPSREESGPAPSPSARHHVHRDSRAARSAIGRSSRTAARLICEKGYEGASIQDIAEATGLTKAGSTTTSAARSTCCSTSRTTGWTCSRSRSSPRSWPSRIPWRAADLHGQEHPAVTRGWSKEVTIILHEHATLTGEARAHINARKRRTCASWRAPSRRRPARSSSGP
jgi:hypothetical protein